jgi:hypothetical protein
MHKFLCLPFLIMTLSCSTADADLSGLYAGTYYAEYSDSCGISNWQSTTSVRINQNSDGTYYSDDLDQLFNLSIQISEYGSFDTTYINSGNYPVGGSVEINRFGKLSLNIIHGWDDVSGPCVRTDFATLRK